MSDNQLSLKEKADLFLKMAGRARARYESLRTIEWKLNMGLWTLLAAGTFATVTAGDFPRVQACVIFGVVLFFTAVILWLFGWHWLPYIHEVSQRDNGCGYWHEHQVRVLLDVEDKFPAVHRPNQHDEWIATPGSSTTTGSPKKQMAKIHYLYLAVTVALAFMFVGAIGSKCWPDSAHGKSTMTIDRGVLEMNGSAKLKLGNEPSSQTP